MTIPAFQNLMLPLMKFASDGQEHTPRETVEALAEEFSLSEADRHEMLPSGRQVAKGNFFTTTSFTNGAREYMDGIDSKIVLIGGNELAKLMVDFDVGVSTIVSYDVKKIDSDYFTED